jgi:hypothetical protein
MGEVLRVEVEELTGPGGGDAEEGQRVYEPTAEIERAMMGYEAVSVAIGGREPVTAAFGPGPRRSRRSRPAGSRESGVDAGAAAG